MTKLIAIIKKKLKKIIITLCAVVFILISGEILYFHHILSDEAELNKADLIVVFAGSYPRIRAAYDLANSGYADYLVISPASGEQVSRYQSKLAPELEIKYIIEKYAGTTFENALLTQKIIKDHNFDSVILVTSFYHLPRSYFLLRTFLLETDVKIQNYGVSEGCLNSKILNQSLKKIIIYCKELTKFWGNILELLISKLSKLITEPFI